MLAHWRAWSNSFFIVAISAQALAADAKFLGKDSCSSSGCHGGGGGNQNQSTVWAQHDQHSRAPATLTTARSKRLAQLLNIADPTRDSRCTSCHAPWQNLPASAMPANTSATAEAVSCESCHGPAENYLRSHTRKDLTRTDKLADGLRDMTILYNRANSCVACHQCVDSKLMEVGHPELLFELDGQTASMPRHWREKEANTHAVTWLTGQAAALRELTAQLMNEGGKSKGAERVFLQWQSALWVINTVLPASPTAKFDTNAVDSAENLKPLHSASDKLALEAAALAGKSQLMLLENLAKSDVSFSGAPADSSISATRAERLVIAIDRLLNDESKEERAKLQPKTDALFQVVQSRPNFRPGLFAATLKDFQNSLMNARK